MENTMASVPLFFFVIRVPLQGGQHISLGGIGLLFPLY